jgi:chromosome segregation ATPase
LENWKVKLKASDDRAIHNLQLENKELKDRCDSLSNKVSMLVKRNERHQRCINEHKSRIHKLCLELQSLKDKYSQAEGRMRREVSYNRAVEVEVGNQHIETPI